MNWKGAWATMLAPLLAGPLRGICSRKRMMNRNCHPSPLGTTKRRWRDSDLDGTSSADDCGEEAATALTQLNATRRRTRQPVSCFTINRGGLEKTSSGMAPIAERAVVDLLPEYPGLPRLRIANAILLKGHSGGGEAGK